MKLQAWLIGFRHRVLQLNIDIMCANSPQAKGCLERANLALPSCEEATPGDISTIDAANAYAAEFAIPSPPSIRAIASAASQPKPQSSAASRAKGPRSACSGFLFASGLAAVRPINAGTLFREAKGSASAWHARSCCSRICLCRRRPPALDVSIQAQICPPCGNAKESKMTSTINLYSRQLRDLLEFLFQIHDPTNVITIQRRCGDAYSGCDHESGTSNKGARNSHRESQSRPAATETR
ncbi:hypothetical protein [Mesorhizobium onobrychidis]|uniref:hypothetical protein n=1 Tax=Mesorhizobium onobrychidis TaxID=2775404 RepID=UPI003F8F9E90